MDISARSGSILQALENCNANGQLEELAFCVFMGLDSDQIQFPRLPNKVFSETVVRLFPDQVETGGLVNAMRRS